MALSKSASQEATQAYRDSDVICDDNGTASFLGRITDVVAGNNEIRKHLEHAGADVVSSNPGDLVVEKRHVGAEGRATLKAFFESADNGDTEAKRLADREAKWQNFSQSMVSDLQYAEMDTSNNTITIDMDVADHNLNDMADNPTAFGHEIDRLCSVKPSLRGQLEAMSGGYLDSVVSRVEENGGEIKKITLQVSNREWSEDSYEISEHHKETKVIREARYDWEKDETAEVFKEGVLERAYNNLIKAIKDGAGAVAEGDGGKVFRISEDFIYHISGRCLAPGDFSCDDEACDMDDLMEAIDERIEGENITSIWQNHGVLSGVIEIATVSG